MSETLTLIYNYDRPDPVTHTVTLPEDWDDYTQDEKNEFLFDEAPWADAPPVEWDYA